MKFLTLFLFIFSLFSCNTSSLRYDTPLQPPLNENELVFPFGTYKQKIIITREDQENKFSGVLATQKESMGVYAFGPMGVRVFSLKENYERRELNIDTSIEALHDKKEFIRKLYPVIKKVFLLTQNELKRTKEFDYQLESPLGQVHVSLDVKNPSDYSVRIVKEKYFSFLVMNE